MKKYLTFKLFYCIPFLFALTLCPAQTYGNSNLGKSKRLNVLLRINPDNTVNMVLDQDENGLYAEYLGNIKQINDSIFHITATLSIGQFYMMAHRPNEIIIVMDPAAAPILDKITLTYSNGVFVRRSCLDKRARPKTQLDFPVTEKLLNNKKGSDFYTLSISRKGIITGAPLNFKIEYGSAASFTAGRKIEFDIQMNDRFLWTFGEPPLQSGLFKLERKSGR